MGAHPYGVRKSERHRSPDVRRRRALLALLALVSFAAGVVLGARHVPSSQRAVERFAASWERNDFAAMHGELSDADRARVRRSRFASLHRRALETATAQHVTTGPVAADGDGVYRLPVAVRTRVFGTVRGAMRIRAADDGLRWSRALVFPGLREGERLSRTTRLPPRATLLARDKTPLAQGPDRTSPLGELAASIVGSLGPMPAERRAELAELGVPEGTRVGTNGLERVFDARLLGTPGGELRAGGRVLAVATPRRAAPVRTTISIAVQRAAVEALGDRLGGVVALDPRNGALLGAAGIGFSGLQPPGSTFKIVTLTGALEARLTSPGRSYPVETYATLEGVKVANADGESCGGTLVQSFAHSCNSVFAPLGARLGARRLVEVAERFGFNRPASIPGAATSTIPAPSRMRDDLAVGASAIGQGKVQATALQMALVAAAIGRRGRLPRATLDLTAARARAPARRVTSPRIARTVERMMRAVVSFGTGTATRVPGKTGTAELRTTTPCVPDPRAPEDCPEPTEDDPTDTDAWFAAYAPSGRGRPRAAVAVMLVASGSGGETAAPAARGVLQATLRATD